ncbi:MAG TPA: sigma-70 family RNA polymerase sigma factor [Thermomicrobiales bacterium]|nr:sigma-70 family RNA polymerase sigma factor [Thermomicrobiales bacterium]
MDISAGHATEEAGATDSELVLAAQQALPAFEHLYRRYIADVYRFCLRRLANDADAADATSQIFARALINIGSCDPTAFRAWLFTIARNVVTDTWRSAKPGSSLEAAFDLADTTTGPEELAIASQEAAFLRTRIAELSPDQRAVIELRLAGLSATEIAMTLGKSRNAIDQTQFRAINRLRTLLTPPVVVGGRTP